MTVSITIPLSSHSCAESHCNLLSLPAFHINYCINGFGIKPNDRFERLPFWDQLTLVPFPHVKRSSAQPLANGVATALIPGNPCVMAKAMSTLK